MCGVSESGAGQAKLGCGCGSPPAENPSRVGKGLAADSSMAMTPTAPSPFGNPGRKYPSGGEMLEEKQSAQSTPDTRWRSEFHL